MRVLTVADYCFVDRPGGMARVAWDIAQLLRDRGHDVTYFAAVHPARPDAPACETHAGIRLVRYRRPDTPRFAPGRLERVIQAARSACQDVLADTHWDLVHIHSPITGAGVVRALGRGPRYVYTMHSPVVLEQQVNWSHQGLAGRLKLAFGLGPLRRVEREALAPADAIHTLSEFTRRQAEHFHGVGDRVTVIPHWRRPELRRTVSRQEARRQLGWPVDERILLTVRGHGPRYGIDTAIQAIGPLARQQRCVFIIGGDGPLRPKFERLAAGQHAGDRIRFVGRLSDHDLALAYQAADLFILPTLALECFGLVTIEAFSYGCPVLSSDAGAIPETMEPIMPRFIVPAGDVAALRQKVDDYLSGRIVPPDESALTAYVSERFDADVIVPKLLRLLEG